MAGMKYRFSHRSDDGRTYYWVSVLPVTPNDSRHEQVSCRVDWFWNPARATR
ncbi:hypothetical protein ACMX2H_16060 [Arthrobacter sulfonylureivorans]|uniref:hypothetical protein n=1 Tax=Arthrobacter sulfonylureivorans TaxID=2486855 RepID=UPI0039E445B9